MPKRKPQSRSGAAVVEFAVVAPIIFMLFFAAFEFARMNLIRHTVDVAAYQGCRTGILPGASADKVRSRVETMLSTIGVDGAAITISPSSITRSTRDVSVDIQVALDAHTWVPAQFLAGRSLSGSCTLMREEY